MVQKRKSSFSFKGKTSARAVRDKKEGASYGYLSLPKNVSVFSPEPGSSVKLDIIPYIVSTDNHPDKSERDGVALKGDPWYRLVYWRHAGLGANGNESAVCLSSVRKKCPICEYRAKRIKQGAVKEETDVLKPSKRVLYNVIPIGHDKFEKKLHIFDISYFNFQNLLDDELRENDDYSVFPDLEEGLTLKTRFASKTIADGKPFPQASRIDFLDREKAYNPSILDKVVNLDEVLQIETYKQLQAKLFEMDLEGLEDDGELKDIDDEEEEEEEDDASPKKKVQGKDTKKKSKCSYGHTFGEDHDEFDECGDCEVWDDCLEEKEG